MLSELALVNESFKDGVGRATRVCVDDMSDNAFYQTIMSKYKVTCLTLHPILQQQSLVS